MITDKITQASLNNWLSEGRESGNELWCHEIGGFHVRVIQAADKGVMAKARYRVKYRSKGKQRTKTIGVVGQITLSKARKVAISIKSAANLGKDIIEEERQAKQKLLASSQENKAPSLSEWYKKTLRDELINQDRRSRVNYFDRWIKILNDQGLNNLDEISVKSISPLIKRYTQTKTKESTSRKYLEYLKELISAYARRFGLKNPLKDTSWDDYVEAGGLKWDIDAHDQVEDSRTALTDSEFSNILRAAHDLSILHPDKPQPLAISFIAFTGMRPSDTMELKWDHVHIADEDYPHIRKLLRKTKSSKKSQTIIPICDEAVEILHKAKSLSGGPFVFSEEPRAKASSNLTNVWWPKVREITGYSFVLYQLRHNLAHRILRNGGAITDVAAALGNTTEVCIKNYLNDDPRYTSTILRQLNLGRFME